MLYQKSAVELAALLKAGETSSVEIVKSLQQRADDVEAKINGFTVQLREEALKEAEVRDQERAKGEIRGPLHGLPITIKDNIDVAGAPSTLGVRSRVEHRAEQDAVIVRLARESGAVILGKSNVPQALVAMHCDNHVWGASKNPWSAEHVTGGSSGGEGALLASGMSVLGVGSDLGGSIRFPAGFCGVAGLKPTNHRWSNLGSNTALPGQEFVRAQIGPMARTTADLSLLFRTLDSPRHSPLDKRVAPIPIGNPDDVHLEGLRIGYFDDDGFLTPSSANQRALCEAVQTLRDAGAELVEFPPQEQLEAIRLYVGATSSDGLVTLRRLLQGEPVVDALKLMWRAGHLPAWALRGVGGLLPWLGEKRLGAVTQALGPKSAAQLWELAAKRQAFELREQARWHEAGIDALVCPATASPAVPVGMGKDFSVIFGYYGRFNLLGWPAGVVPFTRVRFDETERALNEHSDRLERRATQVQSKSKGLPVGVQVVAPPWREDVVLALMQHVEDTARQSTAFPITPVEPFAAKLS